MGQPFEDLKAAMADRYVLEQELGVGRMATVFLVAVVLNWFDELRAKSPPPRNSRGKL